ncbi:MAG: hypothetical protein IKR39_00740 [Lachnospiraceae bacterium]|nr:hypothetical protein [Lachnospiraceae bacterium]
MNSRLGRTSAYFILIVLSMVVFFYWASKKEVWFCDEVYTYESANGVESEWPNNHPDKWISGADVESYLAADDSDFRFKAISDILYGDHVPLYFWIFRTVSVLFFRGSASIWIGLSINLFFFLLAISCCYFFVCKSIGAVPAAVLTFLVMVLSRVGICQFTVLRMYMMMLCAEILLLVLSFRIIGREKWSAATLVDYVLIYAVTTVGLMTHYDFWIFYGFCAAFCCLFLLGKAFKQWKTLHAKVLWSYQTKLVYGWCISFAAALLTLDRLFPYWKWNLHKGKGQTALSSLVMLSHDKLDNIGWGFKRLVAVLFGEKAPVLPVIIAFYALIVISLIVLSRKERFAEVRAIVITMAVSVAYRLVVCYTLPDAREERYLWCAITLEALCFGYSVIVLIQTFLKSKTLKYIIAVVLCMGVTLLNVLNLNRGNNISYLMYPDKNIPLLESYSDVPWLVYGPICGVYSYYDWIIPKELCFVTEDKAEEDAQAVEYLKDKDSFILYVNEGLLEDAVDFIGSVNGTDYSVEYLMQSTNLKVYAIKR